MADSGKQTEVFNSSHMCNMSAEKVRRNTCEFDCISFEAKRHAYHE